MNALRVETCILYMYFKETSLISHASLESWNKESIKKYPTDSHPFLPINPPITEIQLFLNLTLKIQG